MERNNSTTEKDEITDLLKELDLNIDVDVAFLAAQTPPIKIFPTPNTSHLPYNKQMTALEADYVKYYEYRGDLTYNQNMKRSIAKKQPGKGVDTCLYRVCRDKNRFFETRMKDDVLILGKILESMIERTSEMEKHLEHVLMAAGVKELPKWDELYEEMSQNAVCAVSEKNDDDKNVEPKQLDGPKVPAMAPRPKNKTIAAMKQNLIAAPNQLNGQDQPTMTHEEAQMRVAQLMFARSHSHANRIHSHSEHSYSANRMNVKPD